MEDITERQLDVLRFVHQVTREQGYPPSLREIGAKLGIASTKGTHDHLVALERKGFITRTEKSTRSITITREGRKSLGLEEAAPGDRDSVLVPVVGRVAAGPLDLAEENLEDTIRVDLSLVGGSGRDVFGLRIRGDSMIGDGIVDGSIVLVRKTSTANPGAIVIALVDNMATCKRYYPERNQIRLQPSNPTMFPIFVKKSDLHGALILGVVVGTCRRIEEV